MMTGKSFLEPSMTVLWRWYMNDYVRVASSTVLSVKIEMVGNHNTMSSLLSQEISKYVHIPHTHYTAFLLQYTCQSSRMISRLSSCIVSCPTVYLNGQNVSPWILKGPEECQSLLLWDVDTKDSPCWGINMVLKGDEEVLYLWMKMEPSL